MQNDNKEVIRMKFGKLFISSIVKSKVIVLLLIAVFIVSVILVQIVNASSDYDWQSAVAYAKKWALSRNTPEYESFEEDCTNFVSQCIRAGGIEYKWSGGDRTSYYVWWHILYDGSSYSFVNAPLLFQHFIFVRNGGYSDWITNVREGDIMQIACNPDHRATIYDIFHSRIIVGFGDGPSWPDPNPNGNPYCAQHTTDSAWVRWDLTATEPAESIFKICPYVSVYFWTPTNELNY